MYYVLFTTTTCTKCPSFKKTLADNVKCEGKILNEQSPEFGELASRFGIASAPTIIFFEEEGLEKELFRTGEEYDLVEFLKKS